MNDLEDEKDLSNEEVMSEFVESEKENIEEDINNSLNEPIIEDNKEKLKPLKEEIKEIKHNKNLKRREKRKLIIKTKLLYPEDIKYRGIFSYRHLRIIAWITLAIGQLSFIFSVGSAIAGQEMAPGWVIYAISIISSLTTPIFAMATFATILNKNKSYKSILIFYIVMFIAIGLGIIIIYERYVSTIFKLMYEDTDKAASVAAGDLLGAKVRLNIFSDLLIIALVNFFITYVPQKFFQNKKIYLFRSFAILPILYAIASYTLSVLNSFGTISLPFEIYPFLTTKPPVIYLIFITIILWMKHRERLFGKLNISKDEYDKFLKTNRNSLSFSIIVCIIIALISIIDFLSIIIFAMITRDVELVIQLAFVFNFGDSIFLFLAIPIMLLFSYTRTYKDTKMDLIIPMIGIGLVVLTYLEGIKQIINFLV